MSDLISREWVLNKIREREKEPNYQHESEDWCVGLIMAENIVDSAPTIEAEPTFEQIEEYCRKRCLVVVDGALFNEMKSRWGAEPVKHGHWVYKGNTGWHCSECDAQAPFWCFATTQNLSAYCPNCGAKMLDEKESEE